VSKVCWIRRLSVQQCHESLAIWAALPIRQLAHDHNICQVEGFALLKLPLSII